MNKAVPASLMAALRKTLVFLMCFCALAAQQTFAADPSELSFGENITQPKVASKGIKDLKDHIKAIEASFIKRGISSRLERNGEVVVATIPCSVLFAPNSVEIMPEATQTLAPFAEFMKYPTMYKLVVSVYADDTGDDQYADELTSARANAINTLLSTLSGTNGQSLIPYGMGKSDPVDTNDTMKGRSANRRVEIRVVPEWQMIEMAKSGKLKQK